MATPPESIITYLPAHRTATVASLPAFTEKTGDIYFVEDENGVPLGIAKSGKDKRLRFYSVMETAEASGPAGQSCNPAFDSLLYRAGLRYVPVLEEDRATETITIASSGEVLAVRKAIFGTNSTTVTTQFYERTFSLDGAQMTTRPATDMVTIDNTSFIMQ